MASNRISIKSSKSISINVVRCFVPRRKQMRDGIKFLSLCAGFNDPYYLGRMIADNPLKTNGLNNALDPIFHGFYSSNLE